MPYIGRPVHEKKKLQVGDVLEIPQENGVSLKAEVVKVNEYEAVAEVLGSVFAELVWEGTAAFDSPPAWHCPGLYQKFNRSVTKDS